MGAQHIDLILGQKLNPMFEKCASKYIAVKNSYLRSGTSKGSFCKLCRIHSERISSLRHTLREVEKMKIRFVQDFHAANFPVAVCRIHEAFGSTLLKRDTGHDNHTDHVQHEHETAQDVGATAICDRTLRLHFPLFLIFVLFVPATAVAHFELVD